MYDILMEMVINEDSIEDYRDRQQMLKDLDEISINEGAAKDWIDKQVDKINGLTKIGLTRDDLVDPTKVEAAIKKIKNIKDQNNTVIAKAIISIFISVLGIFGSEVAAQGYDIAKNSDKLIKGINAIVGVDYDPNTRKKWLVAMGGILAVLIANLIWTVNIKNDYQKLMSAFDSSIKKIDKAISKENKASVPNKEYIKSLEKNKKLLIDNKSKVYNKYKEDLAKLNNIKEI